MTKLFKTDYLPPPYEQLPASRRPSPLIDEHDMNALVEKIMSRFSSTNAGPEVILSIKDMVCRNEFNELLVKQHLGVAGGDSELYRQFEHEVDEELERRGFKKHGVYTPTHDARDVPEPSQPTPAGRSWITRIAGAAGLGLGAVVIAPVAVVAGIAGAGVTAATLIVGGVGDGLNYSFKNGIEVAQDRWIAAPVVVPVAAVSGIAGGAVKGVSTITGGVGKGLLAAFDQGISTTNQMMRKARDFATDAPGSP